MTESFDVVVIGGGVIGMTGAWRLAQTGRRVLLLERDRTGAEASSAAAGMLGAQLEVSEPGPFYQLCLESRSLYQAFVDELLEYTGVDAQLIHNGIYQIAFTQDEVRALEEQMEWQIRGGARAEFLSSTEVTHEEPTVAENYGALYLPDDSNVYAPLLTRALSVAVKKSCSVVEGAEVTAIRPQSTGDFVVSAQNETYVAGAVVVAAGAWAQRLLPSFPGQIQPVKGQLLAIRPRQATLKHTLFNDHAYLVPKRNGTIVVGATEDREAGYNRDVTTDAIQCLLSSVKRIAPGLCDATFERSWIGLRPGSSDPHPWIGQLAASPGLHVAAGHFRNGILLAPVTANMLVDSVEGRPWPSHWQAFHPARASEKNEVTR
ncbi:glycine oxidase ThiO [Alicyclobacillus ferrooxydans]|uniref:glycine oxidase n=1 Tax=Alicyclobacillus ferrooxydans TaxID=471514 RepID=A0A0P9CP36_9BACL|nr:glycine oxidase ThiO [Alicyclobacillus ferrooxydans]KPV40892.1 glycine oxidase [Alicyclobacillus ferrooxydans]